MTIPNLITVMRLVLVPLVIVAITQTSWVLAFALFVVAGVSDALDGAIARRFDMRSEFGAYLDPLADKALLVSIYVTLSIVGVLPGWLAVVVVSRDAAIVAAILVSRLLERPMAIRPLFVSKANTAVQIAFAAFVLGRMAFEGEPGGSTAWGMAVVAALTAVSAAAYLARWMRHMAGE